MTKRLALVISAVVIATLLLAGFGTILVGNFRARNLTERELSRQVVDVTTNLGTTLNEDVTVVDQAVLKRRLRWLNLFKDALEVDDLAVVIVQPNGNLRGDELPAGVNAATLDVARLRSGEVISGNRGNLVFAANATALPSGVLIVIVLTNEANSGLRASLQTFLLAALATLAIGVGVAVIIGRRLSKPIRDASAATAAIARGDLSTRLPEPASGDTDELAELSRSVNAMATELQRSRVLEQQFLLSVSHDLRTPLTSIRGYAEAISDGAADPQRSAAVIKSEARRLERLVADLLDLAKLQSRAFTFHAERIDLAALADVACDGFRPDASERSLHIQHVGGGQIPVTADHDRLAQAVANLIENALKYARTTVTVITTREGNTAILAVDDDGPGIPPADRPHVFDRLYVARSQPTRHESSSGLGLAIVKELVQAMGGTVDAGQSPSGGARLVIRLPLT